MRLTVDTLIALLMAGLLVGVIWVQRERLGHNSRVEQVHKALQRLHDQAAFHGAMAGQPRSSAGVPLRVSPLWFEGELPLNRFMSSSQPWIDVAPEGDLGDHPPDPVIVNKEQGGIWYNPNRRIFRARVAGQLSEAETLRMYNTLNKVALKALPISNDAKRKPRSNTPSVEDAVPSVVRAPRKPGAAVSGGRSAKVRSTQAGTLR